MAHSPLRRDISAEARAEHQVGGEEDFATLNLLCPAAGNSAPIRNLEVRGRIAERRIVMAYQQLKRNVLRMGLTGVNCG